MNFELDESRRALQDSIARLLRDRHGFEQYRAIAAGEAGFSDELWREMAQMGLPAMLVPESYGGIGGDPVDLLVVMRECGRSLLASPLLACSVLPAIALAHASDEAVRAHWLPAIATAQAQVAWAHEEPSSGPEGRHIATRARRQGDTWRLRGRKPNVSYGASAGHFLVSARVAGSDGDADGLALFLVDGHAEGVARRAHRLVDDSPAAELEFSDAAATPVTGISEAGGLPALRHALAAGIAALCADMVGCMDAAVRLTIDYLNLRKQFGKPIGANQALRHRVAEMQAGLEMAASMAIAAAVAARRPEDPDARRDLHRAKLLVGRQARAVCHAAIQLHGGIGMTQEYAVGHYLRRVHVLDSLFGDPGTHAVALDALLSG